MIMFTIIWSVAFYYLHLAQFFLSCCPQPSQNRPIFRQMFLYEEFTGIHFILSVYCVLKTKLIT